MNTNDGGPAFPTGLHDIRGASLRDWFAGNAPITFADAQVICGHTVMPATNDADLAAVMAVLAKLRFDYADAMLAARSAK